MANRSTLRYTAIYTDYTTNLFHMIKNQHDNSTNIAEFTTNGHELCQLYGKNYCLTMPLQFHYDSRPNSLNTGRHHPRNHSFCDFHRVKICQDALPITYTMTEPQIPLCIHDLLALKADNTQNGVVIAQQVEKDRRGSGARTANRCEQDLADR